MGASTTMDGSSSSAEPESIEPKASKSASGKQSVSAQTLLEKVRIFKLQNGEELLGILLGSESGLHHVQSPCRVLYALVNGGSACDLAPCVISTKNSAISLGMHQVVYLGYADEDLARAYIQRLIKSEQRTDFSNQSKHIQAEAWRSFLGGAQRN